MSTETEVFIPPFEDLKKHLPKRTSLYYVDRGDEIPKSTIITLLKSGTTELLDDVMMDWDNSSTKDHYLDEIKSSLENEYEEDVVEAIMNDYEDHLIDHIHDVDDSTPLSDIFRNTGEQTMFYDTGYYMEGESWSWTDKEVDQEIRNICKHLKIKRLKKSDSNYKNMESMIRQASYGGELVIYFYESVKDFCTWDHGTDAKGKPSHIVFTGFHLAVINVGNGSGSDCEINTKVTIPYIQGRVNLCSSYKYSYTHQVCWMSSNWCQSTCVEFEWKNKKEPVETEPTTLDAQNERDKKFAEAWKKGQCSLGDMDITRHRNTRYINDFPCGTRCESCGTFWID